jgi:hypothetical protein
VSGERPRTLVIACGALAREALAIIRANGLSGLVVECLPAELHNRPELIAPAMRAKIRASRGRFARIYALYADCGTGGALDAVLDEEAVPRLTGPHCFASVAGQDLFEALHEAEPGTFYLTDFLARQFETLVWKGLWLDRHPELLGELFGHYRRVLYLAQTEDEALTEKARRAAERLGLSFERRWVGYGELAAFLRAAEQGQVDGGAGRAPVAGHPGPGDRQVGPEVGQAPAQRPVRAGHRHGRHARAAHRDRRLSRAVAAQRP